jgi:hypothetical protein
MGLHYKGYDRLSAVLIIWRFEHHAAWWVYLTLGAKGVSYFLTFIFKIFGPWILLCGRCSHATWHANLNPK